MKNIILLAAPAAGKGTLASILKDVYKLPHISTGDLLRDASKEDSPIGKEISEILASGNLVSNDIVYKLLERKLESDECADGYILDGFPRTVEQAIEYENILKKLNYDLGKVILLDVEKDILKDRIVGRRLCKDCGAIYNVVSQKPKKENVCDLCGGSLYQRSDDNEESFENRYQTYIEKTQPLIDYYKEKNILYTVDGSKDKDYTFNQVKSILESGE